MQLTQRVDRGRRRDGIWARWWESRGWHWIFLICVVENKNWLCCERHDLFNQFFLFFFFLFFLLWFLFLCLCCQSCASSQLDRFNVKDWLWWGDWWGRRAICGKWDCWRSWCFLSSLCFFVFIQVLLPMRIQFLFQFSFINSTWIQVGPNVLLNQHFKNKEWKRLQNAEPSSCLNFLLCPVLVFSSSDVVLQWGLQ